jgi:hypothetical protein
VAVAVILSPGSTDAANVKVKWALPVMPVETLLRARKVLPSFPEGLEKN